MPSAIVLGLSSHGLALCRALKRAGAKVYALESNPALAAVNTNTATIIAAKSINDEGLIDALVTLAASFSADIRPVIFPTNDKMVRLLAKHWPQLQNHYALSWSKHRQTVLRLQSKHEVEAACADSGLLYPQSLQLHSSQDIALAMAQFSFPAIVKPVNPMSTFKVKLVKSQNELEVLFNDHAASLPFLIQQWIEGDDEQLVFCSMFLVEGLPSHIFTGKKLGSIPKAMGQGTIMAPHNDEKLLQLSCQFFAQTGYTGPASLEFKIDNQGQYWVIEPNIGRTEFSVQCAISNQVDLVAAEFEHTLGKQPKPCSQANSHIWFDTEKDITCYLAKAKEQGSLFIDDKKPVFPFLDARDLKPFAKGMYLSSIRAVNKLKKIVTLEHNLSLPEGYSSKIFTDFNQVRSIVAALPATDSIKSTYLSTTWFDAFVRHVNLGQQHENHFLVLFTANGEAVALLALYSVKGKYGGRELFSLTNYYSPIFDVLFDNSKIDRRQAVRNLFLLNAKFFKTFASVNIFPMYQADAEIFSQTIAAKWIRPFPYRKSVNWFTQFSHFDNYVSDLSSRTKNTYRRKLKKLSHSHQWQIHIAKSQQQIALALEEYNQVYNKSWKQPEPSPEFICQVVQQMSAAGLVRVGILKVENKPIAAQIWMLKGSSAFIYKLAYDNDYRHFSVGTILTFKMSQVFIEEEQIRQIDFLTGDDQFKAQWMTQHRDLVGVHWVVLKNLAGWKHYIRNQLSLIRKRLFAPECQD